MLFSVHEDILYLLTYPGKQHTSEQAVICPDRPRVPAKYPEHFLLQMHPRLKYLTSLGHDQTTRGRVQGWQLVCKPVTRKQCMHGK